MDYSRAGQGPPFNDSAAAGRRRGVRREGDSPDESSSQGPRSSGCRWPSITAVIAACGGTRPSPAQAPGRQRRTRRAVPRGGPAKTGGTIASPVSAGQLDPVAMQDLASYGMTAQTFEFLCTLDTEATDIAPGLAERWTPNQDNSVWTFKLRQGVKWQDGTDFTAADVVATMERLVAAGNAGLKGVIEKGSAVATDPNTVTLTSPAPTGTSRISSRSSTPSR